MAERGVWQAFPESAPAANNTYQLRGLSPTALRPQYRRSPSQVVNNRGVVPRHCLWPRWNDKQTELPQKAVLKPISSLRQRDRRPGQEPDGKRCRIFRHGLDGNAVKPHGLARNRPNQERRSNKISGVVKRQTRNYVGTGRLTRTLVIGRRRNPGKPCGCRRDYRHRAQLEKSPT